MSRPYRRSYRTTWLWILVVLLVLTGLRLAEPPATGPASAIPSGWYRVDRVVDAETLLLEDGIRVRLQGIGTAETGRDTRSVDTWATAATNFTRRFVEMASPRVRVEFGSGACDPFGCYLANVWHDDRLLNEELLQAGLAQAVVHPAFQERTARRFRAAESAARQAGRGIWSE